MTLLSPVLALGLWAGATCSAGSHFGSHCLHATLEASDASASVVLAHHTHGISFSEMALFSKIVGSCGFVGLQSHFTLTHFFPAQNWHSRCGVWQVPFVGLGPVSFFASPHFLEAEGDSGVCVPM